MPRALWSKENDCRSCYKCIRNCPTKSISFHDGQASIIPDECILCGKCYLVCPQGCKVIRDDLDVVKALLEGNQKVIASVAPSFLASYPGASFATLKNALLALGFSDAEETAVGATIVKREYDRLCKENSSDVIISTCCHSVNLLIEKHYPGLAKYLAPVLSPMLAHAYDLKKRYPGAKVVFLGPCISKKNEIEMYPDYDDAVLTFLELDRWFQEKNIKVEKDSDPHKVEESLARLFPIEGGILKTMARDSDYSYLSLSGSEECLAALKDIQEGKVHHAFIEMSSCVGSCINGPAVSEKTRALVASYLSVEKSAGKKDFLAASYAKEELKKSFPAYARKEETFSEEEIESVLRKIGKISPKDELNCSSCGYSTCREKAKAVLEGKANLEMCLPYLMKKAQSFSNTVVENSDNAIFVLDEEMRIQLANASSAKLLGVEDSKALIGKEISSYLDTTVFGLAMAGTPIKGRRESLANLKKEVAIDVTYDADYHILIAIYRDITQNVENEKKEKEIAEKTASITTEVIERNMRAVQEIASLLGESTAETKVALVKLKEVIAKKEDSNE